MKMSAFYARRFEIPEPVLDAIERNPGNVTAILHENAGRLGDYEAVKTWYKRLSTEFNWVGATLMFNILHNYHQREAAGELRYRQTMVEKPDGPGGYLRFLHLSQDSATRRRDCTKIEETIIADPRDLRDASVFRFMYDYTAQEAEKLGQARLLTELGVGLSPRKYRVLARTIASLKGRAESVEDKAMLQKAKSLFHRDWVGVTRKFTERIGFKATDMTIPEDRDSESTPQLRSSRLVGSALPLQAYQAKERVCIVANGNDDPLAPLQDAIDGMKRRAAQKFGLA